MDDYNFFKKIEKKYKDKLSSEITVKHDKPEKIIDEYDFEEHMIHSVDYNDFKKELMPKQLNLYESLCSFSSKLFNIPLPKEKEKELQGYIDSCHLNVKPSQTESFSWFFALCVIVLGLLVASIAYFFSDPYTQVNNMLFFIMIFLIVSLVSKIIVAGLPKYIAKTWRMKASDSLIQSVFYLVTFLRHTPNLELAIHFAAEHLPMPLALDFKKIVWSVETNEYSNIVKSMNHYLLFWKDTNPEYVETVQLIMSSLNEGDYDKKMVILERSLDLILNSTYDKMLKFSHSLKSPMTTLHMLGIIMPLLGSIIMPLAVSFMDTISWFHIGMLYNVLLPMVVFMYSQKILTSRPSGTNAGSDSMIFFDKKTTIFKKEVSIVKISVIIAVVLIFIGLGPVSYYKYFFISSEGDINDIVLLGDPKHNPLIPVNGDLTIKLLDYTYGDTDQTSHILRGPYSFVASIFGLLIVYGIGMSLSFYFDKRSLRAEKIRKKTRQIEEEFSTTLFQLGNRLGDGLPLEIAFERVLYTLDEESEVYKFFQIVVENIKRKNMGVEDAIYDPQNGALKYYPSPIIKSSMKVLIDSSKKGPLVASNSILSMSEYIKKMDSVEARLSDLLGETIGSMKSQIKFLSPLMMGIVSGIATMIGIIIVGVKRAMTAVGAESGADASQFSDLISYGMSPYFFQVILGLYVLIIVYIMSRIINSIEYSGDAVYLNRELASNFKKASKLYCSLALVVTIVFSLIAISVMGSGII